MLGVLCAHGTLTEGQCVRDNFARHVGVAVRVTTAVTVTTLVKFVALTVSVGDFMVFGRFRESHHLRAIACEKCSVDV